MGTQLLGLLPTSLIISDTNKTLSVVPDIIANSSLKPFRSNSATTLSLPFFIKNFLELGNSSLLIRSNSLSVK